LYPVLPTQQIAHCKGSANLFKCRTVILPGFRKRCRKSAACSTRIEKAPTPKPTNFSNQARLPFMLSYRAWFFS
jgi:hypothetical protein